MIVAALELAVARWMPMATWAADVDASMDLIERQAFAYFWEETNPHNGLVRNTTEPHAPASITACGAALSAIPIGIERGWILPADGYLRALRTLKTLAHHLEHIHGFFYHFLNFETGKRTWVSEVSCIDTAIAAAGALVAGEYFKGTEVDRLAQAIYERIDWPWFLDGEQTLQWAWKPETGFEGGPIHFSEGILAYLLALGSPTHPIRVEAWHTLWRPVSRYGEHSIVFVHDGSLFAYLLPLAWFDLRERHDVYLDYWTNARNAVLANRQFCQDHRASFRTYREGFWGLSAALGPDSYRAYGGKPGVNVHDGTVAPYAVAASVPFAPDVAWPTYQRMLDELPTAFGRYGLTNAFNLDRHYVCPYYIALDQGLTLFMLENARSGLIWRLFMSHPAAQRAVQRAGFQPGHQEEPTPLRIRRGNPAARLGIHRLTHPVGIDGDLAEWLHREPIDLTPTDQRNLEFGFVRSKTDASLDAYLGWDEERFYVAGVVRDDEIVNRHRGSMIYQDDSVELFFDLDRDGFWFNQNPFDAQVGLAPTGPTGEPQVWVWGPVNRHVPEVESAVSRRGSSYVFELAVPWSVIGGRPDMGQPFRFAVTLHDRDRDGKEAKLVWSVDKETDPGRLLFGEAWLSE